MTQKPALEAWSGCRDRPPNMNPGEEDVFADKELTGCVEFEHVGGKSTATRLFSKYPLKLMMPSKVAHASVDVVWLYSLSYGGGILSGDAVFIKMRIGTCCTAALTTQASTKVYKSIDGKFSEQLLQVFIESKGVFVLLPDPVTCFAAARYKQYQAFYLASDANMVLVDWCTSGRRERGEIWSFDHYRSTNHIFLDGEGPLLLDSMCLESNGHATLLSRMQPFQVVAMVLVYGPLLHFVCKQLEEAIQLINRNVPGMRSSPSSRKASYVSNDVLHESPRLLVSCSRFGPKEEGLVVRIVSTATELVYEFLRQNLSSLSTTIGVLPYSGK